MELDEYQERAQGTNLLASAELPVRLVAPMLGLATEAAALLDVYKQLLTDAVSEDIGDEIFRQQLGDLLWYVAAVAKAKDFSLEEIAQANLTRTEELWAQVQNPPSLSELPVFDAGFPEQERFPRRLAIEFVEVPLADGRLGADLLLQRAEPNAFPDGPVVVRIKNEDKDIGFAIGDNLGDRLTDNSRRVDGYRFHDAIHMGFMALLGWSPTMRAVLQVKRRSDDTFDEVEDGARAIFLEEGLAAVLSRLAPRRMWFLNRFNVGGETLAVAKACVEGLEAEAIPGWAWRQAIIAGFRAMKDLEDNHGGVLHADLDARTLEWSATP